MDQAQELAWAAGLFEGEGCITVSNCKQPNGTIHRQPRLKISMTDEDAVLRFHSIIRLGWFRENKFHEKYGYKIQYEWGVSARKDVISVLNTLMPYLCARRAAKGRELLAEFIRESD